MTKKPRNMKRSLQAHRRVEKSYRLGVFLHAALFLLSGVLLILTVLLDWHVVLFMVFGIALASSLIGLLADISALRDRRRIIAETVAHIESAEHASAEDGESWHGAMTNSKSKRRR